MGRRKNLSERCLHIPDAFRLTGSSVSYVLILFRHVLSGRAIFVATPPLFRGGLSSPRDLEVKLNKLFPNSAIFLEKPVATGTPWETSVEDAKSVGRMLETQHKGVVSVG